MTKAMTRGRACLAGVLAAAALLALPAPGLAQPPAGGESPTFTRDIAPIFQRSCQACHRQGEMAPMSLVTYEEVRPWARSIRDRVVSREMPPWHIDRNIGIQEFEDDPSLSDAEIAVVAAWVDNGAPRGDPADMPPPRVFPDAASWQIGEPDLIVRYPTVPVPAEGPDMFGSVYAPLEIDADRYIQAIQHRPVGEGSQRVVHHALSFVVDLEEDTQMPSASGHFLVEYASGKGAEVFPDGIGVLLQAGRKLKLDYHLHPVGEQIDAVVEHGDGRWLAVEVKLGSGTRLDAAARSLTKACQQIDLSRMGEPAKKLVITAEGYGYDRPDGVSVIPITALGP